MVELTRLIWTLLINNAALITLVGSSDNVKVAFQSTRVPKPGVTIQLSDGNKLIPEVHSIKVTRFLVVAWSTVGDVECDRIGELLFNILDDGLSTDANVFVYDSEVSNMAGPYWDDKEKSWRKDIALEAIVRSLS